MKKIIKKLKGRNTTLIVLGILIVALIVWGISDTYSYYEDRNSVSILSSRVGDFSTKFLPPLEALTENAEGTGATTFTTTEVSEMYRYKGTASEVDNNYICFGTNDKDECLNEPDTYMYRIIGIQASENATLGIPANSLKIIKASKYGSNVVWSTSYTDWGSATLNNTLNTTFYGTIPNNKNGINWQEKIISHTWCNVTDSNTHTTEPCGTKTAAKNIGLMYASDYYNSGSQDTNNWLFISHGWTGNTAENEWTMSRYDDDLAWAVSGYGGYLDGYVMTNTRAVRPVFYLIPDILLSGKGTTSNPYLITPKPSPKDTLAENTKGKDGTVTLDLNNEIDGLYRYKGTATQVTNNYICFGTNDKSECLNEPDTYMYRIIGIQATANATLGIPANSLKIIKASKYGGNVMWSSSYTTWDYATVYTSTLNTYYNSISTTNSGVNWKNLILSHYWYIGDNTNTTATAESTTKSTTNKPTGLMYKSDYINANGQATTNWLFIQNGWSGNTAETEWTMSRYNISYAWDVDTDGTLFHPVMSYAHVVRPVFYLIPDILLSGKGTTNEPYLITPKPSPKDTLAENTKGEDGTVTLDLNNEIDGLYRYKGTHSQVTNNYICFGTIDKEECLNTPETYMYRIIGIQASANTTLEIPANSLKIIKASKYGSDVVWSSSYTTWDSATLNNTLNTTFYGTIPNNKNGINWQEKIISHKWCMTDNGSYPWALATEPCGTQSAAKNIGLMYGSDYYNSGSQDTNNWLFISHGWSGNASEYEWTMSRYSSNIAWYVDGGYGSLDSDGMTYISNAVRPVFYLKSNVRLNGAGTTTDPYIITN